MHHQIARSLPRCERNHSRRMVLPGQVLSPVTVEHTQVNRKGAHGGRGPAPGVGQGCACLGQHDPLHPLLVALRSRGGIYLHVKDPLKKAPEVSVSEAVIVTGPPTRAEDGAATTASEKAGAAGFDTMICFGIVVPVDERRPVTDKHAHGNAELPGSCRGEAAMEGLDGGSKGKAAALPVLLVHLRTALVHLKVHHTLWHGARKKCDRDFNCNGAADGYGCGGN